MNELLRDLQLAIGASLVAVIWMIQILHYPSFLHYDKAHFSHAMNFHQKRITYIVVPLMLSEFFISVLLCATKANIINFLGLGCVLLIWASTFFIHVPLHSKLKSYDENLIKSLVRGNAIRTLLWTSKFLLIESDRILKYLS